MTRWGMLAFLLLSISTCYADAKLDAQATLETLVTQYSNDDLNAVDLSLSANMIGRQALLDEMLTAISQQAQIRITLSDFQYMLANDIVVISCNWQKRYLLKPAMTPELHQGRANFILEQSGDGWHLAGLSGNSPFAP